MTESYTLDQYVSDLREIAGSGASEDEIFERLGPLASRLALDKGWLREEYYQANPEQGFGTYLLHEEPDHSLAVFAVNWLPKRGAPPHDHGTWAVVAGVEGIERNIRYNRLDDGSQPGHAELEEKHAFDADAGDVICMKTGGIHAVRNETDTLSISLHTYGRHVNHTSRSQFDLEKNEQKAFIVDVD